MLEDLVFFQDQVRTFLLGSSNKLVYTLRFLDDIQVFSPQQTIFSSRWCQHISQDHKMTETNCKKGSNKFLTKIQNPKLHPDILVHSVLRFRGGYPFSLPQRSLLSPTGRRSGLSPPRRRRPRWPAVSGREAQVTLVRLFSCFPPFNKADLGC